MSSFNNVFQIAKDMNGPPGLIHPLLVENFAWVDERLREMYNGYALTASNCDEYEAAGLLKENYAWVDASLAEKCSEVFIPCPLSLWLTPRDGREQVPLEDDESSVESYIGHKRKRSESDISDYEVEAGRATKRLRCQSPIPTDYERYNELASAAAYETESSVSSLDLESDRGDNYSRFCTLTTAIPYDEEFELRFANCPTPPVTINALFDEIHLVTEDEESVYYDTDYDCDGYDSF